MVKLMTETNGLGRICPVPVITPKVLVLIYALCLLFLTRQGFVVVNGMDYEMVFS